MALYWQWKCAQRCTATKLELLQRWLIHFKYFSGHHFSTQRWLTSTRLAELNMLHIPATLCIILMFTCRRINWSKPGMVFHWFQFQLMFPTEPNHVKRIEDAVHADTNTADIEMNIIISEKAHHQINSSMASSYSRLRSFKLNDMGFGLNRISPITMDREAFHRPENRETQHRAPTSTPHECNERPEQAPAPPMNRTYSLPQPPQVNFGNRHQSYDTDTSTRESQRQNIGGTQGRFIPPHQIDPSQPPMADGSTDSSNRESPNETTIYRTSNLQVVTWCTEISPYAVESDPGSWEQIYWVCLYLITLLKIHTKCYIKYTKYHIFPPNFVYLIIAIKTMLN